MSFWNWVEKLAPVAIAAGATLYGAHQQSKSNDKAAAQATTAQQGATQAQVEAIKVAEQTMGQQQRMASPGLVAMQGVIGRGERLTPEQELALADARRRSVDALQGGSLRGSARATAATVNDVDGRMRTEFMAQNRNRVDQAASNLSGQYFNAGNNIADLNLAKGTSVSQGLVNTGDINAANTMGQGVIKGQAIGDIGAVIADSLKTSAAEKRESAYKTTAGGA